MPRIAVTRKDVVKLLGQNQDAGACAATGTLYIQCLAVSKFDESKCASELKNLQACLLTAPKHDRVPSTQRRRTLIWNILRTAQQLAPRK